MSGTAPEGYEGHEGRLQRLRAVLGSQDLDALVVTNATNIRYLTGFTGSNGTVVVSNAAATLITDSRYTERAAEEICNAGREVGGLVEVVIKGGPSSAHIGDMLTDARVVGLEASDLSWAAATEMQSILTPGRVRATSGIVEGLREQKTSAELAHMVQAAAIADGALADVIEDGLMGRTERDVQRALDGRCLERGADGPSFDTIVASGPNGSRPHHEAGNRTIAASDLVIIDFGAEVSGYRSDMTRAFMIGEPSDQQREMLEAVEEAQAAGVAKVQPGCVTSVIDEACRSVLEARGLGQYFTHGTGHGVGLDIHEAPSVSSNSTATLAPGYVVTVEPGVYIPDVGGVRWEDTVVVTEQGAHCLTQSPKQPFIE